MRDIIMIGLGFGACYFFMTKKGKKHKQEIMQRAMDFVDRNFPDAASGDKAEAVSRITGESVDNTAGFCGCGGYSNCGGSCGGSCGCGGQQEPYRPLEYYPPPQEVTMSRW